MKCFKTVLIVLIFISCSNQEKRTAIKKEKINAKVNLGKKLFFDPILSLDKSISCASCHQPQFAFADNKSFSIGVNDSIGTRNTPSVMNMASRPFFFHDGRAATLEEQAVMPVENPVEMNLSFKEAVNRINKDEEYLELFKLVYKTLPNSNNITNALAEFQRSLESDGSAPHDLWIKDIDTNALTISLVTAVVAVISVQPTSEKLTALHDAASPANAEADIAIVTPDATVATFSNLFSMRVSLFPKLCFLYCYFAW